MSFLFTLKFCAILDKNCTKKLHVKNEKVAKSCNIKLLETSQNIELHRLYFGYLGSCWSRKKSCKNLSYLLYLYVSCNRCMHMHLLFSPNPMKLGLIGMLSASLHYIMIKKIILCLSVKTLI